MPPKIPKHPLQDVELNMNEVLTYSDGLSWPFFPFQLQVCKFAGQNSVVLAYLP